MLALIDPRAVVVLMRSVAARVAYADSSVRTFARRMAGRTACAAHSIRTFAALLAMPRLRSQCTKVGAIFLVGSMRVRSAVHTPTPVRWYYISMLVSLRFLLSTAALLGCPLPGLLFCPFGVITPLHFVHLGSRHSKFLAFRWSDLPHALHRGLGQLASMGPRPWQCSHSSSLGRSWC